MTSSGSTPLAGAMQNLLSKRKACSSFRSLTISPPTSIDFSSNDFLSLSTSAELKAAYLQELQTSHDFRLGSGGSRLLDGNSSYAEQLETDIADFHHAPAGLLFNSGFDANSSIFACIPQAGDVIFYDEFIHASVHEGMRLSRADARSSFLHNSVPDLETQLSKLMLENALVSAGRCNVFVATESLFSMDGDLAPIQEIVELVERLLPLKNGHVIVDEAHSNGVYGPQGRGIVCSLGLENRLFIRLHTFGKGLACNGAMVLCSKLTREYLVNYARPLIYSTSMSFPSLAAIRVVYSFMKQGHTDSRVAYLNTLIECFYRNLQTMNTVLQQNQTRKPLSLPPEKPSSPIFSLLTPEPRSLANFCQDAGFVVRPIVSPTVPRGTERVRVCLHAGNTFADVENLVARIKEWLETSGDIGTTGSQPSKFGGVLTSKL